MSQPPTYNRQFSFTNYQTANPTGQPPGTNLDVEFNTIKTTLDSVLSNLARIQNDDTTIKNASVGADQLAASLSVGFSAPTAWVTATAYVSSPASTVFQTTAFYKCLVSHTSGVFATDLAAGKWAKIMDLSTIPLGAANQIAITPAGGVTANNVQQAIYDLDTGKAATSHAHVASAISDSTAAGRAMLTAASVAAQQSLLGLGSLAFLNTVPLTTLATTWLVTGSVVGSLAANTNDWAPTGLSAASVIRASTTAGAVSVTGLAGGADGRVLVIDSSGPNNITLTAQDTSSAAANRFLLPRAHVLRPNSGVTLKYDSSAQSGVGGWRPMDSLTTNPIAAGYKNLKVNFNADTGPTITADAITLEDANGESWRVLNVNVTASNLVLGAINGLDTGTNQPSTGYYAWVIGNPTTGVIAALLSTNSTAPTFAGGLAGYTFKARVGWSFTDATASPNSKFKRVVQYGRRAQYVVTGSAPSAALPSPASGIAGTYSTTAPTWSAAISLANFVPATASLAHFLVMTDYKAGANGNMQLAPNANYKGYADAGGDAPLYDNRSGQTPGILHVPMVLEALSFVWTSSTLGGAVLILGWEDNI